ncbi:hypothetical protein A9Q78_10495 [Methylophaga sp. 41_12_T18]|nr:hypothetical protein A9Q78_10495 [Methylophaga sp. 41_12_T18]
MGNGIAYAALVLWPLIAIYLYRITTIQVASIWVILGGFMLLPVKTSINLPMIPEMGKHTIPVISALFGCWLIKKQRISFIKELGKIKYLVILFIVVPFFTAGLNSDPLIIGGLFLPSLSYYDGLALAVNQFLVIVPFFIGRQFFKTYDDQLLMFKLIVIAGLYYSLLMLLEVRLSPQLHTWLYGYFPHSFGQQMRFSGFRPVVFMGHGLLVSFFTVIVLICAVTLWKNRIKFCRFSPAVLSYYLLVVLVLCKSVASTLYGLYAFLLIKSTKPKTQHKMAVTFVCLALVYPAMSMMKIFPHQTVINVATSFDQSRAESLEFRFENEEILLEHSRERFFFGWGGWGRNRVYNEKTGKDDSVTDGRWIITLGQFGILGFIAEFGLLAITVFRAYAASKLVKPMGEQSLLAAHSLLIGVVMIDQLPNATLAPWLWLLAGILLGRSEAIISKGSEVLRK